MQKNFLRIPWVFCNKKSLGKSLFFCESLWKFVNVEIEDRSLKTFAQGLVTGLLKALFSDFNEMKFNRNNLITKIFLQNTANIENYHTFLCEKSRFINIFRMNQYAHTFSNTFVVQAMLTTISSDADYVSYLFTECTLLSYLFSLINPE